MKIGFVSQPYDRVLPPGQNSVGICTYGLTRSLSKYCKVVVLGLQDQHEGFTNEHDGKVEFCFVRSSASDRLLGRLRAKCSKLVDIRAPFSASDWSYPDYGRRVARELQRQECDVIHLQQCSQYARVIREANPDAKIVLHLHAPWFSQCDPKVLAERARYLDLVTTVSEFVRQKIQQSCPNIADRCETAYNGIDPADFVAEKEYGRGTDKKRILFVGAVSPHSGVHVLLDSFRRVAAQIPNVSLDIAGALGNYPIEEVFDLQDWLSLQGVARFYRKDYGRLLRSMLSSGQMQTESYISNLISRLPSDVAGKIRVLGPINDRAKLIKLYYAADVFAFAPVCNHGFGLPPLEAMAAGTPVVASRSGAVGETIVDQQTGLLVRKNDAGGLAAGLVALLEDDQLRQAMGTAARQRALSRFTWDAAAENMYGRYLKLFGDRGRSSKPIKTGAVRGQLQMAAQKPGLCRFSADAP